MNGKTICRERSAGQRKIGAWREGGSAELFVNSQYANHIFAPKLYFSILGARKQTFLGLSWGGVNGVSGLLEIDICVVIKRCTLKEGFCRFNICIYSKS